MSAYRHELSDVTLDTILLRLVLPLPISVLRIIVTPLLVQLVAVLFAPRVELAHLRAAMQKFANQTVFCPNRFVFFASPPPG